MKSEIRSLLNSNLVFLYVLSAMGKCDECFVPYILEKNDRKNTVRYDEGEGKKVNDMIEILKSSEHAREYAVSLVSHRCHFTDKIISLRNLSRMVLAR